MAPTNFDFEDSRFSRRSRGYSDPLQNRGKRQEQFSQRNENEESSSSSSMRTRRDSEPLPKEKSRDQRQKLDSIKEEEVVRPARLIPQRSRNVQTEIFPEPSAPPQEEVELGNRTNRVAHESARPSGRRLRPENEFPIKSSANSDKPRQPENYNPNLFEFVWGWTKDRFQGVELNNSKINVNFAWGNQQLPIQFDIPFISNWLHSHSQQNSQNQRQPPKVKRRDDEPISNSEPAETGINLAARQRKAKQSKNETNDNTTSQEGKKERTNITTHEGTEVRFRENSLKRVSYDRTAGDVLESSEFASNEKMTHFLCQKILSVFYTQCIEKNALNFGHLQSYEDFTKRGVDLLEELLMIEQIKGFQTKELIGFYLPDRPLCWVTREGHLIMPRTLPIYVNHLFDVKDSITYKQNPADSLLALLFFGKGKAPQATVAPTEPEQQQQANFLLKSGGFLIKQTKWLVRGPTFVAGQVLQNTRIPGITHVGQAIEGAGWVAGALPHYMGEFLHHEVEVKQNQVALSNSLSELPLDDLKPFILFDNQLKKWNLIQNALNYENVACEKEFWNYAKPNQFITRVAFLLKTSFRNFVSQQEAYHKYEKDRMSYTMCLHSMKETDINVKQFITKSLQQVKNTKVDKYHSYPTGYTWVGLQSHQEIDTNYPPLNLENHLKIQKIIESPSKYLLHIFDENNFVFSSKRSIATIQDLPYKFLSPKGPSPAPFLVYGILGIILALAVLPIYKSFIAGSIFFSKLLSFPIRFFFAFTQAWKTFLAGFQQTHQLPERSSATSTESPQNQKKDQETKNQTSSIEVEILPPPPSKIEKTWDQLSTQEKQEILLLINILLLQTPSVAKDIVKQTFPDLQQFNDNDWDNLSFEEKVRLLQQNLNLRQTKKEKD